MWFKIKIYNFFLFTEISMDLIPCEICEALIPSREYNDHVLRCLRLSRITGFLLRQQRHNESNDSNDSDDSEEPDESASTTAHDNDIVSYTRYFTTNSQVSRISLHDLINDHFNGVRQPSQSFVWFRTTVGTRYDANNIRLGDEIGRLSINRIDVGLTEKQLKDCSYESFDAEELVISNEDICPICHENLIEKTKKENGSLRMLACNHIYCNDCIKTWLSNHKTCPVCKVDLEDAYCWGR